MKGMFLTKIEGERPFPVRTRIEMEFHISREARDKYKFDQTLFKSSGNILFPNFPAVRQFTALINHKKDITARAGDLNAMGLMDEIFHHVAGLYREQKNPKAMEKALDWLYKELGREEVEDVLKLFSHQFPPMAVYNDEITVEEYLEQETQGVPHRQLLLEELIMLWVANMNPACKPYRAELLDDTPLRQGSSYKKVFQQLEQFFRYQPPFGPDHQDLLTMMRSPAIAVPDSIPGQLQYIREHWGLILEEYLSRLLSGLDLIKEEEKFGGLGPGETLVYDFAGLPEEEEYEKFSRDHAWMPRLVLLAKSSHVWLDQLSKKYRRAIQRLDQVPDEELDEIAQRGFTGLWLIGLWERSRASQKIKQMCGNPEAMASAYSIFEYRIADELGGTEAVENLKLRASQRGIRMASDMVPNHMGLDSPWLVEHPDWFMSLNYCPFPSYTFNGPDLSADPRISIFLEDHYYDRTDAAVVFKWLSNENGEVRYIYHGNDGTSMPWNDTAQLNYLNPEVREAVINTIFSVAQNFPVIRFDAAMTLAKKHYQRLWFPEPGAGGDIPTRAGNGMPKTEFNNKIPTEFWREVVDRFAGAGSDTLLLAEAFWMMEAYFVRTLGMHRVYNSAFMNFLKNEDNAQFRTSIKNVLTFNPRILKRFVNFMNNPDEETAIAQFGKDDKYIGICTLMVTLPGLPMFGHGQIEGYAEKYGMEYRRAYWDETPDPHLLERHEREIFPLMRKRYIFAEVENFLLYDFYTPEGWVNEDVLAYSNRFGDERSLVVYHNKYATTSGWIRTSVPFLVKTHDGEANIQKSLSDGLSLEPGEDRYTIFRDQTVGLEYIRNSREMSEKGLFVKLEAFKRNVFLDFRQVEDENGLYAKVAGMLQGEGVPSIDDTLRRHFMNPLLSPFEELLNLHVVRQLQTAAPAPLEILLTEVEKRLRVFLEAVKELSGGDGDPVETAKKYRLKLERMLQISGLPEWWDSGKMSPQLKEASGFIIDGLDTHTFMVPSLTACLFMQSTGHILDPDKPSGAWEFVRDWMLTDRTRQFLANMEASPEQVNAALKRMQAIIMHHDFIARLLKQTQNTTLLEEFFSDPLIKELCGVNVHEGVEWIHKESFHHLLYCFYIVSMLEFPLETRTASATLEQSITRHYAVTENLRKQVEESGYRLDKLIRPGKKQ